MSDKSLKSTDTTKPSQSSPDAGIIFYESASNRPPVEGVNQLPLPEDEYLSAGFLREAYDLTDEDLMRVLESCQSFLNPKVFNPIGTRGENGQLYFPGPTYPRATLPQLDWYVRQVPRPSKLKEPFLPRLILLNSSIVPRVDAVVWLDQKRFPFIKEVKGLQEKDVNRIIAEYEQSSSTPNKIPDDIVAAYENAQCRGKKKILAVLYKAQGLTNKEIAERLNLSTNPSSLPNVSSYIRQGKELAKDLGLPDLTPYTSGQ